MFIFLSTPAAILQLLKRSSFLKSFIKGNWAKSLPPVISAFIKDYMGTGVTLLCNKIFLLVVGWLAIGNHFATKTDYHKYIFRLSYAYFVINMVIMPGLTISGGATIFKLLQNGNVSLKSIVESFHLKDHGAFFTNLIFQGVGIGFLMCCLNFYDLIF
jgi:hypothetical protein